ncbi:blue copper protein-like [Rutidosis leptorrhynchoides]|uniref:blue copper protein-like n=1 Tax=Rutidosis leptorrhynchoides TaxID=125765 RepID=UPI003A9992F1
MTTYNIAVLGLTVVILSCTRISSATVYTVGDTAGWALSVDYDTWASDKTFKVGDTLVFNYDTSHTVDVVTSTDYTTCAIGNSIASYTSGTTTIALKETGSHYFICGIMGHCSGGMKLTIDVTGDDSVTSPAPAPSSSIAAAPSSIIANSPVTTPFGTTLPDPTVAGNSNNPLDSSSAAISLPYVAVVFILAALVSQLIIG